MGQKQKLRIEEKLKTIRAYLIWKRAQLTEALDPASEMCYNSCKAARILDFMAFASPLAQQPVKLPNTIHAARPWHPGRRTICQSQSLRSGLRLCGTEQDAAAAAAFVQNV